MNYLILFIAVVIAMGTILFIAFDKIIPND